jgi:rhodanese-related sulfurtransferase
MKHSKTLLALALAMAATTTVNYAATTQQAKPADAATAHPYTYKTKKLDRPQIDALLAKPSDVVVLDVRRPDEISRLGGFPAYLSIQADDLEKYLAFIPKDRAIVTVSNHAGRAGKVGDLLTAKGYKVVGAIGVEFYEQQGGTLTKIAVPPAKTGAADVASPKKS